MSDEAEDFEAVTTDFIESKILKVLEMYPRISRSMLQVGLGTALAPRMWSPIFDRLVSEGRVRVEQFSTTTTSGREMSYHVISLVPKNNA